MEVLGWENGVPISTIIGEISSTESTNDLVIKHNKSNQASNDPSKKDLTHHVAHISEKTGFSNLKHVTAKNIKSQSININNFSSGDLTENVADWNGFNQVVRDNTYQTNLTKPLLELSEHESLQNGKKLTDVKGPTLAIRRNAVYGNDAVHIINNDNKIKH